jgi:hypothetical protein
MNKYLQYFFGLASFSNKIAQLIFTTTLVVKHEIASYSLNMSSDLKIWCQFFSIRPPLPYVPDLLVWPSINFYLSAKTVENWLVFKDIFSSLEKI